ncbi:MAG: adenylate cyclase [Leptospiraceae bacterium]|nr:adenylate cyclase [Leptospiraceae bacterium]
MKSFLSLVVVFLFLLSCGDAYKKTSIASKGILDLRDWNPLAIGDIRKEKIRKTDGEWEFYSKELLTANDFTCDTVRASCEDGKLLRKTLDYIQVPHSWNGHPIKNSTETFSGDGFATYRLTVSLPEQLVGEVLALRSEYQGTAYRIFINAKLTQSVGVIGKEESEAEAMHLPSIGFVHAMTNKLEIIVQVSNYHNRLGGLWNHLYLGRASDVQSYVNQLRGTELFVIGIIFIIWAYHLLIWSIRRKEGSPLFFSLLCLIVLIRLISTSEYLFVETFPSLGYKFYCLLEYGSMYFSVPVAIQYFTLSIKTRQNKYIVYFTYFLASIFMLFTLLTPVKIFSKSAELYQIILLLSIIYLIYSLVYSVAKKIEYSFLSLFGFLVLAATIVQDILYSREVIQTGFYSPYALVVMIFTQAMILSLKFSKAFKKVEELTESLEIKVTERTKELNSSKEDIEALNNFTNVINSYSDLKQIFIEISKYVYQKYNIAAVWLYLPDEKEQYLQTFKIYSHTKIPDNAYQFMEKLQIPLDKDGGISAIVWKRKNPFFAKNSAKLKFPIDREVMNATGSLSLLEVPLLMRNKAIGLMAFSNIESPMQLNKADIKKINVFCSQIAGVVNTVNLLFQTEKQRREIEELNSLIKSLNEDLDIKIIMKKVLAYIGKNFNIQHFGLSSVSSDKQRLKIMDYSLPDFISQEDLKSVINTETRIQTARGAHAIAFKSRKVIYSRVRESILNEEELFLVRLVKAQNLLMIPLILQNEPIGFLDLYNIGELALSKEDITKLSILGEQLAGIIHGSNLFIELQEAKRHAEVAKEQAVIEKKIAMIAQMEAEEERNKSDKLLLNILPELVAEELKEKGSVQPVYFENVTIMFTDFVGFTKIAEDLSPHELIKELDLCFSMFDNVLELYGLEKLKTIGDSYMCAGGIPKVNKTKAVDCCLAALEILSIMNELKDAKKATNVPYWELRIGIHSGPAMAGVVGEKKFAYDIWGDTVNIASRMESSGTPGRINISIKTYEEIKERFDCEYRGKVNAKNKGEVDMFYLNRIKKEYSNDKFGRIPNKKFFERKDFTNSESEPAAK